MGPSLNRRSIRANLQLGAKKILHSSRRVCHVPCCGPCRLAFPSPSVWAVRFPGITTGRGSVILTRTIMRKKTSVFHRTCEEWEELSGFDSATLLCQRPEQQRQEHQTCEKRDPTRTTHVGSDGLFLPLAKRFGKGPSPPPPRAHSAPRTATCIPSSFFFTLDVSTTQQVSDECELHNKLPLCVVPKISRKKPLGHGRKCKRGLLSPSFIEWRCLWLQKF